MTGQGRRAAGVWLGLFAMLMLHAGPLYAALCALSAPEPVVAELHAGHIGHQAGTHRHTPGPGGEPGWLTALELCGYCELLTLNPPLALSPDLALPHYAPAFVQSLPRRPLPVAPRHASGHPRAPPASHI